MSDAMLSLYMVSGELAEANPMYKTNVDSLYRRFRDEDLIMAVAMSDTKGDRSLHPSQQADPDMYVHKVAERGRWDCDPGHEGAHLRWPPTCTSSWLCRPRG